jgi:heme exporter protein C
MTIHPKVVKGDFPVGLSGMGLVLVLMLYGIFGTFSITMPEGGFRDREAYRVVFLHVPMAWVACLGFVVAAWKALLFLVRRRPMDDRMAAAAAELGLVFAFLATATGMVFAKTQWGVAWNWDPRQTSIFFVMLIYAAYLVLRQALGEDEDLCGRLSGAYLLLVLVPMLWLVGMYPRMMPSLHPEKAPLDKVHWHLMFTNFAAMIGIFVILLRQHRGLARLHLAARERWL